jgi:hypothetical protein
MPARQGRWELVGEPADPIVADVDALQELLGYYATMADEIMSEADVLAKVGAHDDTLYKGRVADKTRAKATDVGESLQKLSGRYVAVADALRGYLPELQHGLDESQRALNDAEDAAAAAGRAAAMADPSQNRPQGAPALTSDEQAEVDAEHRATASAASAADAATARLRMAVAAVDSAGHRAAQTIRAAWQDGLHDSRGDKVKAVFAKILKVFVKIFTYLGIALAALAILIPGLGFLTLTAAIVTGLSFAANFALAAMGAGSWLDVITAAVSVLFVGVGGALTKLASIAKAAGLGKTMSKLEGVKKIEIAGIRGERDEVMKKALDLKLTRAENASAWQEAERLNGSVTKIQDDFAAFRAKNVIDGFKEKANWWRPSKALWNEDKAKVNDVFGKDGKGWRVDRVFSMDRYHEMQDMRTKMLEKYGVEVRGIPAWQGYAQGGRGVIGWLNSAVYGQGMKPTDYTGDARQGWADYEDGKAKMTHGF